MSTIDIPGRQSLRKVLFDLLTRVRRLEAVPPRGVYECKLFADEAWPDTVSIVRTGNNRFKFSIDERLDGATLLSVQAFLGVAGSGDTEVMVRNQTAGVDMLNAAVTIPAGDDCAVSVDVDPDNGQVSGCDIIVLDVDAAGGGDAKGLGVIVTFGGFTAVG